MKLKTHRNITLPVVYMDIKLCLSHKLRVLKSSVLSKIFWFIMEEVTREWGKVHYEELHDLYTSSNIIRVIKSRQHGCGMWQVWCRKIHTEFWWRNLKKRDHLQDKGIDSTVVLK